MILSAPAPIFARAQRRCIRGTGWRRPCGAAAPWVATLPPGCAATRGARPPPGGEQAPGHPGPNLTPRSRPPTIRLPSHDKAPSSRGPGHGPFKAATRVRIPSGSFTLPYPLTRVSVVGSPAAVRAGLSALLSETGADELMLTAHLYDHPARLHSF